MLIYEEDFQRVPSFPGLWLLILCSQVMLWTLPLNCEIPCERKHLLN